VFLTLLSDRVSGHEAGIGYFTLLCRQNEVSREKIKKESHGAKNAPWHLRVLTPRTSSEADPSILFWKTRTPPKPM